MGVGQHYNQAGYMGRFYGITNFGKNSGRNIKVNLIETKDILDLKDNSLSKQNLEQALRALVKPKSVDKIFSGTFLSKKVEEDKKINLLEIKFIENCDKYSLDFPVLFNKNKHQTFSLTMDYFSLHEARNFENFSFVKREIIKFLASNQSINDFIEKTYFFKDCNTKAQKKIIKNLLLDFENPKIQNNNQLYQGKIKEIFNSLYLNVWGKLKLDFHQRNWFVMELGTGIGMGNNFVLNLKKPLYKNYKTILPYLWLDDRIKKILDESVIIFLANNQIALGSLEKIDNFPLTLFLKNYEFIHRFLTTLCLAHSYKYIIIADHSQLDFLLSAFTLDFPALIRGIEETNLMLN